MATKLTPAEWTKEWDRLWLTAEREGMNPKQAQRRATEQMREREAAAMATKQDVAVAVRAATVGYDARTGFHTIECPLCEVWSYGVARRQDADVLPLRLADHIEVAHR